MPSRQDQLHSYQFAQQRVVAALVAHDPDPQRSPLRSAGTTILVGLVVAMLAIGAAAVYGVFHESGSVDARNPAVVFMDKSSGARYVYLDADRSLHPVLNYSSGLLIADAAEPGLVVASPESLAAVPLGDPLGIPGAPDALPPAKNGLLAAVWTVCSSGPVPRSLLAVGERLKDGTVLSEPRGLLVSEATGQVFLVHHNQRFLIPEERLRPVLTAFGWTRPPLPVAAAWINAIPLGPDLVPPEIPGLGDESLAVPGLEVGRLLQIRAEGPQKWGVVLADGVADLTDVQARLMRADPAYRLRDIDADVYGSLPRSRTPVAGGLPAAVPTLLNGPDQRVCASHEGGAITVRVGPTVPPGVAVPGEPAVPGGVRADLVRVPRGKGAVVVSAASPTAPAGSGTVSIVTDDGRRYPLASRDLLTRLGYGKVEPTVLPGQLVALLPQGPALDPVRARRPDSP
ncbi:MAG: type VII secretion protein EccB [Actinoplanes sp.]